jgi:hypothetical protein
MRRKKKGGKISKGRKGVQRRRGKPNDDILM